MQVKVITEEYFVVESCTRLYNLLAELYSKDARTQDIFWKRDRYKKHINAMMDHAHFLIRKINREQNLGWQTWRIEYTGSKNRFDVIAKHNISFRVMCVEKKEDVQY